MKGFVWNRADVRTWLACAMCFAAGFLMDEVRVEAAVREPASDCAERDAPRAALPAEQTPDRIEAPRELALPPAPAVAARPGAKSAAKAEPAAPKPPVGEFRRVRSAIAATPPVLRARVSADKTSAREALSANDFSKALRVLTRDVPKLADDPEHLSLLAVSLVGVGRFQEAGVIYRALVEHDPHDQRAMAGLKLCEQTLERPADVLGVASKSPRATG